MNLTFLKKYIRIGFSGDHTEVIELDYDPKIITYEDLLDMFWGNHEYGLTTKLKRQVIIYFMPLL